MQLPCLHQLVYGRGVQPAAHGRAVASGGLVVPAPRFEIGAPAFHI